MSKKLTFPYEIESRDGGVWVFERDDDGTLYFDGNRDTSFPSGNLCSILVEGEHFMWPKGSCVYHGPLREETRKLFSTPTESTP